MIALDKAGLDRLLCADSPPASPSMGDGVFPCPQCGDQMLWAGYSGGEYDRACGGCDLTVRMRYNVAEGRREFVSARRTEGDLTPSPSL